ncbi:hypothetical protein [Streptomyces sp. NPDC090025]|uniref:hypothetical protein n=1 Tax=Streptomyces sp. NPDC090025 TaxID=3365922 RepID=UPI00383238F4
MKKTVRAIMVAAAVPALVMSASGAASADAWVTWKNTKSKLWLTYERSGGGVKGDRGGVQWEPDWWAVWNSDGSWNMSTGTYNSDGSSRCLTGYYRQVYVENCWNNRDQTNWWQRWYEIPASDGWKLKNRQTGYVLDDEGSGGIYANATDYNNENQRWK